MRIIIVGFCLIREICWRWRVRGRRVVTEFFIVFTFFLGEVFVFCQVGLPVMKGLNLSDY